MDLGYNRPNANCPAINLFKKPLNDAEFFALARFMRDNGGMLAVGDYDKRICRQVPHTFGQLYLYPLIHFT